MAQSTNRISLGPAVTNLASRHPTVTAAAARTIAEAAPGRFTLGIGAGDSAVGCDTLRPATLAILEQGVLTIRKLVNGEAVGYGESEARLRDSAQKPPILVAGLGPKTLAIAGRVADGVVLTMGRLEAKLAAIATGAEEAGRAPPPFYVLSTCAISDDPSRHMTTLRIGTARLGQLEGPGIFADAGLAVNVEFFAHRAASG